MLDVSVVCLQDGPELVKLSLWNGLHHVVAILGVVEERATLAGRAQLVQVIEVVSEERVKNLFWPERLHVLLFRYAISVSQSLEHQGGIVVELKAADLLFALLVVRNTRNPLILRAQSLLELPLIKLLARNLNQVGQGASDTNQDVDDDVEVLALWAHEPAAAT